MTITVPTGDFVGILSDAIPFAHTDDELPTLNAVRLEWDGEMLHTLATDTIRIAISQWHADDEPDGEAQDDLFTTFGGPDEPWGLLLPLDDAKHLVKVFKLGVKEARVPLTVDHHNGAVTVTRARETGHSAVTVRIENQAGEFPDIRKLLSETDRIEPVMGLAYGAKFIADFARVRPRGPMELTFTGATGLTHVAIGKRFAGAIMPTRVGDERERQAA